MSTNSTGSVERFLLGAAEFKDFEVLPPGATAWQIDVHGEVVQAIDGAMSGANATVKLQTKENAVDAWTDVAQAVVVPGGIGLIQGACKQFSRIINVAGPGVVTVIAKPTHRVQPITSL
jgi:hypothetical protein